MLANVGFFLYLCSRKGTHANYLTMETKAHLTDQLTERERLHRSLAFETATEGIVLLHNNGCLPLQPCPVALYGSGAEYTIKGGTGSGEVNVRIRNSHPGVAQTLRPTVAPRQTGVPQGRQTTAVVAQCQGTERHDERRVPVPLGRPAHRTGGGDLRRGYLYIRFVTSVRRGA